MQKFLNKNLYLRIISAIFLLILVPVKVSANSDGYKVRQWKEDTYAGMFTIHTEYSNGTKQEAMYMKCTLCLGIGKCRTCVGNGLCNWCGGRGMYFWPYSGWQPCQTCGGTGKCRVCHGKGKCICSDSEYPGYQIGGIILKDKDGNISNSVSLANNYGSSESRSNASSGNGRSSSTCSSCGGTGVDNTYLKYWGGRTSFIGHYNSAGNTCKYCRRSDEHYHSKCTKCNVPRY